MKRLLTGSEAAEYCGIGIGSFAANCPVRPKRVRPGQRGLRWDVRDLDKWIDNLDVRFHESCHNRGIHLDSRTPI